MARRVECSTDLVSAARTNRHARAEFMHYSRDGEANRRHGFRFRENGTLGLVRIAKWARVRARQPHGCPHDGREPLSSPQARDGA